MIELDSCVDGANILLDPASIEEIKEGVPSLEQEGIGLFDSGTRKRKIKKPQQFDFQMETALYESRILAQRMKKYNDKADNKKKMPQLTKAAQQ